MKSAFVLGIDGLPYTLAHRLIAAGHMPNLGTLVQRGTLAQMDTTVPDFSCVAWTSFATGVNPGAHGIYGFQDFHPRDAKHYVPDVSDSKAVALWHEVGRADGRTVVVNLPGTYPALPLRGKMVSGFVAPDMEKACYPATFAQTLKTLGYRMDLDGQLGLSTPEHVRDVLWPVFEARKIAIRHMIQNEYWDLCIAVITETDRLQHFYLHALDDTAHPLHEWTLKFYVALDEFIGEVAGLLDGKADLFMVSDHGFEVVRHLVIMHDFLRELGLSPDCDMPPWQAPEIASKTKVFALDPGRFYINRKDSRFPHGCVSESEVADIRETLKQALLELRDPDSGETMVNRVKFKEEGFWGGAADYAPDIVAATKPGYYFRSFYYPEKTRIRNVKWEANHVWNDAIFYAPFALKGRPVIWDVLPTALAHMGVPIPSGIDGRDLQARIGNVAIG